MRIYKATGKIRANKDWLLLDCDRSISDYYRSMIPKHLRTIRPRHPSHVTVIRPDRDGDYSEYWDKYEGREVEFHYSPVIYFRDIYYWIDCFSEGLEDIRAELGIVASPLRAMPSKRTPPMGFNKFFHMTIANCKDSMMQTI